MKCDMCLDEATRFLKEKPREMEKLPHGAVLPPTQGQRIGKTCSKCILIGEQYEYFEQITEGEYAMIVVMDDSINTTWD